MNILGYPVTLTPLDEGGYLVTFPDFPEAITEGNSKEEALIEATDCLEEVIANRIEMGIPMKAPKKKKSMPKPRPSKGY